MEDNTCHDNTEEHVSSSSVFKVEKSLIKTGIYSLIILSLVEIIAYYGFFRSIPDFFSKYGYYLTFLVISILINAMAIYHVKAYTHNFSHMSGMMIGMTIGMSTGFTIGLVVGATNGLFIGSLAGLILGMFAGSYTGKCCGIMGMMEGMMAGLMGGVMGAMTSLMAINDNIKLFLPILILCMIVILVGLIIMIYNEELRNKSVIHYKGFSFLPFITVNFILTMALTFLMVYGPKSFLFN